MKTWTWEHGSLKDLISHEIRKESVVPETGGGGWVGGPQSLECQGWVAIVLVSG